MEFLLASAIGCLTAAGVYLTQAASGRRPAKTVR